MTTIIQRHLVIAEIIAAVIAAVITAVPWRLRQQPTWFKSSNLACGGCDSSRLGLSVPIWLAEAATAADFKGGSGGRSPPQPKKVNHFFSHYFASQDGLAMDQINSRSKQN